MNSDQESLLANPDQDFLVAFAGVKPQPSSWRTKLKKNLYLLIISLLIATCLTIYFYLNLEAIDGSQSDTRQRFKPLSRRKPMLDHESIFSDSGPSMIRLSDLFAHCIVALQIAGQEVVNQSLKRNDVLKVASKGKTLEGANDVYTGADLKSHQMIINTIKDSYRRLKVVSEEDDTTLDNLTVEDDILPIARSQFAQLLRSNLHIVEGPQGDRGSLIAQDDTLIWIDPLDATKEYTENLTDYVTLMACIVHKSIPIAGIIHKPFTNQTYWSWRDSPSGEFQHSFDLQKLLEEAKRQSNRAHLKVLVSRSHAGSVEKVIKDGLGDRAEIIPAGGSGYKTVELIRGNADAYVHITVIKKWDICAPQAILDSIPSGSMTDLTNNRIDFGNSNDKVVTKGILATTKSSLHEQLVNLTQTL